MRLTTRTNLAMRTLMVCAVNQGRTVRKHEIATASEASENHLAQVINALGQHGYVKTTRGRNGGLRLACAPSEISVGEVFRRFEGVVPFADCFDPDSQGCPLLPGCRLRQALSAAVDAFYASLDGHTLADMVTGGDGFDHLLDFSRPITPLGTPCTRGSSRIAAV
ncbi:RrF2 family transcriptional regulator [Acidimangrovimonas sediminis]|uniref:RrF2 family transcriptional regulator n=1 Tax=Acidimangrovimonas sediminis TaxID=2056283 RepID=UPI000C7FAE24|nr:Rrf2 family transcriptional regulator [Acidimangrovimonas sediminis]